jgi:hypothetical protein
MKIRGIEGMVKWFLILSLIIVSILKSCNVRAQEFPEKHTITYYGFDVTFGTRSFTLHSDISRINGMRVLEEGGSAGLLIGNKIWQTKIRQGYFYSAGRVPYTTDLVETELNFNINVLQLVKARFRSIEPYITAGLEKNKLKLYGYYVSGDVAGTNMESSSRSGQPYLGNLIATRASVGTGIQYRIPFDYAFLRLFIEMRYAYTLAQKNTAECFSKTRPSNQTAVSVGVSFGYLNR